MPAEPQEAPDSDVEAIRNNWVSVTPVHFDMTDEGLLANAAFVRTLSRA
jgi:broad specificity polyphosphatase/5'/3'-nucleotidase SurE